MCYTFYRRDNLPYQFPLHQDNMDWRGEAPHPDRVPFSFTWAGDEFYSPRYIAAGTDVTEVTHDLHRWKHAPMTRGVGTHAEGRFVRPGWTEYDRANGLVAALDIPVPQGGALEWTPPTIIAPGDDRCRICQRFGDGFYFCDWRIGFCAMNHEPELRAVFEDRALSFAPGLWFSPMQDIRRNADAYTHTCPFRRADDVLISLARNRGIVDCVYKQEPLLVRPGEWIPQDRCDMCFTCRQRRRTEETPAEGPVYSSVSEDCSDPGSENTDADNADDRRPKRRKTSHPPAKAATGETVATKTQRTMPVFRGRRGGLTTRRPQGRRMAALALWASGAISPAQTHPGSRNAASAAAHSGRLGGVRRASAVPSTDVTQAVSASLRAQLMRTPAGSGAGTKPPTTPAGAA